VANNFNWIPWLAQSLFIPQALFFVDVFEFNWLSWVEATEASVTLNAISWDFPNSVPAEDVIDTEGVEESTHVFEALLPPFEVIFSHEVPVVSWEAPVLTGFGESIGWSACGCVHVEEAGAFPGIQGDAVDADWDVAFENDSVGSNVFGGFQELLIELHLHPSVEHEVLVFFSRQHILFVVEKSVDHLPLLVIG